MNMNLIKQCVTAAARPGPMPATSLRVFFQGYTWNLSSPSRTVLIKVNLLELLLEGDDIIMTHKSVVNNPSPVSCHRRPCEVLHISEEGSHGLWASKLVNAPVTSPTHRAQLWREILPATCPSEKGVLWVGSSISLHSVQRVHAQWGDLSEAVEEHRRKHAVCKRASGFSKENGPRAP